MPRSRHLALARCVTWLAVIAGQPMIWTEDQGWFDQWGKAQRVRDSRDQLYGIARFVAHGGRPSHSMRDFSLQGGAESEW